MTANVKYALWAAGAIAFYMWYRKSRTIPVQVQTQAQYNEANGVRETAGGASLAPPPKAQQVVDEGGYNTGLVLVQGTGGPLLGAGGLIGLR